MALTEDENIRLIYMVKSYLSGERKFLQTRMTEILSKHTDSEKESLYDKIYDLELSATQETDSLIGQALTQKESENREGRT